MAKTIKILQVFKFFSLGLILIILFFYFSKQEKTPDNIPKENNSPVVKILVGYHKKPKVLLKNEIFTPIHLGRDVPPNIKMHKGAGIGDLKENTEEEQKFLINNAIGDNTGENVSKFNRFYCDVSGIYWAYKNLEKLNNPDYIGFFHYRRFLYTKFNISFGTKETICDMPVDQTFLENFGLNKDSIVSTIKDYDIILPFQTINDFSGAVICSPELRKFVLEILKTKYPKYFKNYESLGNQKLVYYRNIYIIKTKIFKEFEKFALDIIEKVKNKFNPLEIEDKENNPYCAFLHEELLNTFIMQEKENYKILELPIIELTNP